MTDDAIYSSICAEYNSGMRPLSDIIKRGAFIYKGTKSRKKLSFKFNLDKINTDLFDLAVYLASNSDKDVIGTLADRNFSIEPEASQLSFDELSQLEDQARLFYEWEKQAKHEAESPIPEDYQHLATWNDQGGVVLEYRAIADHLLRMFHVVSHVDDDDRPDLYTYNEGTGIYEKNSALLKNEINRIAEAVQFKGGIRNATDQILHYVAFTDPKKEYPFNRSTGIIPLKNVCVDIRSGEPVTIPHSHENMFTAYIPVRFDPDADPGPIDNILREYVAPVEGEYDPLKLLYQIPAQAILEGFVFDSPFKTAYLIQGPADGGKSTYIDLLVSRFFSPDFVANECLQDLCGGNRFATSTLPDKFLNYYDDLDNMGMGLQNIGKFKTLTGSHEHSIERKGCSRRLAKIFCVHVFTCNRAPLVENDRVKTDRAWWGRWNYIRFSDNNYKKDPTFKDRYFTPQNVSGFLNKVIETVISIYTDRDSFIKLPYDTVMSFWDDSSDPMSGFISSCFIPTSPGRSEKFDKGIMLKAYKKFCEVSGIDDVRNIDSITKLSQHLLEFKFTDSKIRIKGKGGSKNSWHHVYSAPYSWDCQLVGIDNPIHREDSGQGMVI